MRELEYLHTMYISHRLEDTLSEEDEYLGTHSPWEWLIDWALEVRESPSARNCRCYSALKWEGKEVLGGPLIVPYFIFLIRLSDLKGARLGWGAQS